MQMIKIDERTLISRDGDQSYIIDGSNIAFEQRNSKNRPQLSNLNLMLNYLSLLDISNFKIICDRSLYYCIDDNKGYSQLIEQGIIIESPEGTPSDIFILQYAFQKNAFIISNDRYRDYYEIFGKKWIKNRRISFKIIGDVFLLNKIILKGGENNG